MQGPFDGTLSIEGGRTREALAPWVAAALAAAAGGTTDAGSPDADAAGEATVVRFDFDPAGGVLYERDLSTARPWPAASMPRGHALAALARVARSLATMHSLGRIHGDLRSELVWIDGAAAVLLLAPSHTAPPGALLRARLHPGGAAPDTVAFAAPEVVSGRDASPASDAYALAAIVHATLAGRAPLGQLAPAGIDGPLAELARAVTAALHEAPGARPTAKVLAEVLDRAAHGLAFGAALVPAAGSFERSDPGAATSPSPSAPTSPVLVALMVLGGLIAAVGAVQLVLKSWDVLGQAGHVAVLLALSGLCAAGSVLCARKNIASGVSVGRALSALFASVAAAYSFYLVGDYGKLTLALVLTPTAWIAGVWSEKSGFSAGSMVGKVSAGLCAMVAAGYALYLLGDLGRLLLWLGLSFALLAFGLLRSRALASRTSDALLAVGTQLLWGAGAQALILLSVERVAGPVAAISACVFAITWVLALVRRSPLLGWLAAADFTVCAATLGAHLHSGTALGPPSFSLAVCVSFALLAAAGLALRAPAVATPFAFGSTLSALLSAGAALVVMTERWETHGAVGAVWPYGIALAALLLATRETPVRGFAVAAAAALLLFVPTIEALVRAELLFTVLSVALGLSVLVATLALPSLRGNEGPRVEGLFLGLFSVVSATDLRLLVAVIGGAGVWNESPSAYWWTMGGASAALLALSYGFAARVERSRYRPLQVAALLPSLGFLTLQCLVDGGQTGFTGLTLALGAGLVALGALSRHAVVLVVAALALLANLWVVYFQQLHQVFPRPVLMIGFGVGLLIIGVLYEQLVHRRLPQLRSWR